MTGSRAGLGMGAAKAHRVGTSCVGMAPCIGLGAWPTIVRNAITSVGWGISFMVLALQILHGEASHSKLLTWCRQLRTSLDLRSD